jgi:hypothetical protein
MNEMQSITARTKALADDLNALLDAHDGLWRGDAQVVSCEEWEDRGEDLGVKAHLHLIIDGSPLYAALNYGEPNWDKSEEIREVAKRHGMYFEMGYAWSLHFYDICP